MIKYLSLFILLLMFLSCDVSTMSKEEASNIANYHVNIQIYDNFENQLQSITLNLSDGKKQVIDEKIKILVNNKPLKFFIKQELYYTKKSFYYTDNLERNDSYYFEIILRDNIKYPLAFIKPSKMDSLVKFNIPKTVSKDENTIITWKNLQAPYTLEIQKGIRVKKKIADNITEYGYSKIKTDTLKSKIGEYIIDKSYYEDSLTIARRIEFNLSRKEIGLINPLLKKNSNLTYKYTFEKVVDIE